MNIQFARTISLGIALCILLFKTSTVMGQGQMLRRLLQPKNDQVMELQDKHGPWLILANTFTGDEGRQSATTYAKELGKQFRLPTFIWMKESDEELLGTGERIRTTKQGSTQRKVLEAKYANNSSTSYAVLIGEFHSASDPQISKLRKEIRQFQPKAKVPGFETRPAFLTRNPLLPDEYFQSPPVDDFIEQLNRQEWIANSLLNCPKRFTVRVASFRGPDVVDVSAKTKNKVDESATSALDKAASKAHQLTVSLRGRGVEAYEYHDRHGSYVTVGSFDELGKEVDGVFQYDPRIVQVLNDFCGYEQLEWTDPKTGAKMQNVVVKSEKLPTVDGRRPTIPFDIEGKSIAVPKVQVYSGSLLKHRN